MTVPAAERKAGPFNGNGSTTDFPFDFKVFTTADIEVVFADTDGVETVLDLDSDYSVELNADQDATPGGTVTYPISGTALATGEKLSIAGALAYEQETDIPTGGNFNPTVLENALDKLSMQTQQLAESVSRAAKVPITNAADADTLTQAILVAANNIAGLEVVVANISDIQTVADDLNEGTSEINTVATSIANVDAVGTNISNVNAVAANETNIDTVAGINANVTTVAGIAADVTTVAGIAADVAAVENIAANVTTVAGISAAVSSVAADATDIGTVATNIADVNTVAADIADINTCADNMAAILDAPAQASAAAASAAAAAASLDNFDDRYLGAKDSAPSVDNDGNALVAGALYFNTGVSVEEDKGMWIYDGGTWIQASAASQAILVRYKYVATAAQTTFTGTDANGLTLSYTAGSIIVTLNGVVMDAADYTATSGNSVVLASGAAADNEVCVFAFSTFDIANTYTQAQADAAFVAKTGDQSMTGELLLNGKWLRGAQTGGDSLTLIGGASGTGNKIQIRGSAHPTAPNVVTADLNGTEVLRITETTRTAFGYPSFDCRAWVNFNGTGTVAIRGSGNVTSITDNGTGKFFLNFTTAMPDLNYNVLGSGYYDDSPLNDAAQVTEDDRAGARTTGGVGVSGVTFQGTAFNDPLYASVSIFR